MHSPHNVPSITYNILIMKYTDKCCKYCNIIIMNTVIILIFFYAFAAGNLGTSVPEYIHIMENSVP